MAADPDERQALCLATVGTTIAALEIEADDKAEQDRFTAWFFSRSIEVQVYLAQYFQYALLMLTAGRDLDTIADELFAVCMERRA